MPKLKNKLLKPRIEKSSSKMVNIVQSYEEIIELSKKSMGRTHRYEDAIVLLIDQFNNSNIKKVTIVADDLSFLFKIVPTITNFLFREDTKLCLLFDPKHAYSLLTGKELLMMYKLGVEIQIIDLKETFQDHGLIFNYFPGDESNVLSEVEFYQLRNSMFDHQPIIARLDGDSGDDSDVLKEILKKLDIKRKQAQIISRIQKKMPAEIRETDYKNWLQIMFSNPIALRERDTPIYASLIQKKNIKVEFDFIDLPINKIYYRTTRVLAYKAYQTEELIKLKSSFYSIKGDLAIFHPINLFDNSVYGYYPVNMPFVEYNAAEDRYEVAQGHSRLYALTRFSQVKRARMVVVRGLTPSSFEMNKDYKIRESIIKRTWQKLLVAHECFNEPKICKDVRNIESVTHYFPDSAYQELGELLVKKNILSNRQAEKFSGGKYKVYNLTS